jgi:hypothetical protein
LFENRQQRQFYPSSHTTVAEGVELNWHAREKNIFHFSGVRPVHHPPRSRAPLRRGRKMASAHLTSSPAVGGVTASEASSVPPLPFSPRSAGGALNPRRLARLLALGDEERSLREAIAREVSKSPPRVRLLDKLSFFVGVALLLTTEWALLAHPHRFHELYTLLAVPLLLYRVYSYSARKWSLFLFDFCYWVNILCLVHLWALPASPYVFETAFMLANGPLVWAIVMWRNMLVFHDLDKMTSLFIHAIPPLVTFARRWHYPGEQVGRPELLPPYLRCVDQDAVAAAVARAAEAAAAANVDAVAASLGMRQTPGVGAPYAAAAAAAVVGGALSTLRDSLLALPWYGLVLLPLPLVVGVARCAGVNLRPALAAWSVSALAVLLLGSGAVPLTLPAVLRDGLLLLPAAPSETLRETYAATLDTIAAALHVAEDAAQTAAEDASRASVGASVLPIGIPGLTPVVNVTLTELPPGSDTTAFASKWHTTCDHSYWRVMGLPVLVYCAWQAAYFVWTEVGHRGKAIRADKDVLSSFRWMVRAKKGPFHGVGLRIVRAVGWFGKEEELDEEDWKSKVMFMLFQLAYTLVTLAPTKVRGRRGGGGGGETAPTAFTLSPLVTFLQQRTHPPPFSPLLTSQLFYDHYTAHVAFLVVMGLAATWNGAEFYIEVFTARYAEDVRRKVEAAAAGGLRPVSSRSATAGGVLESGTPKGAHRGAASTASLATTEDEGEDEASMPALIPSRDPWDE